MSKDKALPSSVICALAAVLGALCGRRLRRFIYSFLLGYQIDPQANIGIAYVRVKEAKLGARSNIGHFTLIRNLERLELAENARIGTFNWIFGMVGVSKHFLLETDRKSALVLERDSSVTSRHILDCTDHITIGAFSTIAGFNSRIVTHGIDIRKCRQSCAPVQIGPYCMIGTGSIILKGSKVPEGTVLAAGSCFSGVHENTHHLWSGVPASAVKALDPQLPYFTRTEGAVS